MEVILWFHLAAFLCLLYFLPSAFLLFSPLLFLLFLISISRSRIGVALQVFLPHIIHYIFWEKKLTECQFYLHSQRFVVCVCLCVCVCVCACVCQDVEKNRWGNAYVRALNTQSTRKDRTLSVN